VEWKTVNSKDNPKNVYMILGIGIDTIEVSRLERELCKPPDEFRDTVFFPTEIRYCESKKYPQMHYSARFAAKEAVIKAFANDELKGFFYHDIEIVNLPSGQPCVNLHGRLSAYAKQRGVTHINVSLSHTREQAIAVAVVIVEAGETGTNKRGIR